MMIAGLLLSNFFSPLLPSSRAADNPSELSLDGLPDKGNPKLGSVLNALVAASPSEKSELLIAQEGFSPTKDTIRVIIEGSPGPSSDILPTIASLGTIESTYGDYIQMVVQSRIYPCWLMLVA